MIVVNHYGLSSMKSVERCLGRVNGGMHDSVLQLDKGRMN